ncbi:hypothetical protein BC936DRAFT_137139 [Jimgerdemannia flammicorona]|uniref:Uncharacterized protein n=1 Tax=Jimgerdemannia flammicorona TaxID=994334 RepID=A0A433CY09_9FUNG|nr:hypothetical protein BC936DRAFT_137139 [Jimgerdemannia flammicorona]
MHLRHVRTVWRQSRCQSASRLQLRKSSRTAAIRHIMGIHKHGSRAYIDEHREFHFVQCVYFGLCYVLCWKQYCYVPLSLDCNVGEDEPHGESLIQIPFVIANTIHWHLYLNGEGSN